jgi:hypothetical protein
MDLFEVNPCQRKEAQKPTAIDYRANIENNGLVILVTN